MDVRSRLTRNTASLREGRVICDRDMVRLLWLTPTQAAVYSSNPTSKLTQALLQPEITNTAVSLHALIQQCKQYIVHIQLSLTRQSIFWITLQVPLNVDMATQMSSIFSFLQCSFQNLATWSVDLKACVYSLGSHVTIQLLLSES